MNTIMWLVMLLALGLVAGKVVGMLTAFTRGPTVYDLPAGALGALGGGVLLRSIGSPELHAPLLTLLTGLGAAMLGTWLTRILTWPAEPILRRPDDGLPSRGDQQDLHDLMTTSEGMRLLLKEGRLVAAEVIPAP